MTVSRIPLGFSFTLNVPKQSKVTSAMNCSSPGELSLPDLRLRRLDAFPFVPTRFGV